MSQRIEAGKVMRNGWLAIVTAEFEAEGSGYGIVLAIAPAAPEQIASDGRTVAEDAMSGACRYATWQFGQRDGETYWGHYHQTWSAAVADYNERKDALDQ